MRPVSYEGAASRSYTGRETHSDRWVIKATSAFATLRASSYSLRQYLATPHAVVQAIETQSYQVRSAVVSDRDVNTFSSESCHRRSMTRPLVPSAVKTLGGQADGGHTYKRPRLGTAPEQVATALSTNHNPTYVAPNLSSYNCHVDAPKTWDEQ